MNLKKHITLDTVRVNLPGNTKQEVIEELVDIIVANGQNMDREVILKAILDRESQMSTGMNNGVAIPHGKTNTVSELHVAVAVSRNPVEFDTLDKQPARILLMTISPESQTGPHLEFLAEISRILSREDIRQSILAAETETELLEIIYKG